MRLRSRRHRISCACVVITIDPPANPSDHIPIKISEAAAMTVGFGEPLGRGTMITRRHLLGTAGAGAALAVSGLSPKFSEAETAGARLTPGVPEGVSTVATMEALPGKKPLIKLAYRPPNYEAPIEYLRTPITPNDQFFVRYHLADIPEVDAKTYKIRVGGDGANGQAELTLDDLKKMPAVEVVAVNQCRATGVASLHRMFSESSGATAPWAARAGK